MSDEAPRGDSIRTSPESRAKVARIILIALSVTILVVIGLFFLNGMLWSKRLAAGATVTEERNSHDQPCFLISFETDALNAVVFDSRFVTPCDGSFQISANDLPLGANTIYYRVSREGHERRDSILIENTYAPLTISIQDAADSLGRTTHATISTEPGNRLRAFGEDTVLVDGIFEIGFDPDSIMEAHDPDLTPTVLLFYPVILENQSGNSLRDTIMVAYTFPRVSLSITDPWDGSISRTGGSYTIRGNATSRAHIRFYDGPDTWYTSMGQAWASQDGTFSKYVSVNEFGNNVFTLVASVEGMTSDTARVTIFREMTDSEMRTAYQDECEQVTAEYLADHHSEYIGRKVRVWGRTIEWLGTNMLHCCAGDGHFIADLSGFDRVPALEGLSFTVWGVVTSNSQDFYTSGGDYVHVPVITGVYTTTGY